MIQQNQNQRRKEHLRQEFENREKDIRFEAHLQRRGLLSDLEASGVLPKAENPNPFDPVVDLHRHDMFWRKHAEQQREFSESVSLRHRVLRWLRIGSLLNDNSNNPE